jgi:hypothetical protein
MASITGSSIAREMDDRWKESQSLFQQWWYEADLDTKMMTGQQDYWNTFYNVNYRNQKTLMFNKILRIQNMISGYQIDNRLQSIVTGGDNDPDVQESADQRTTVLNWSMKQDNAYEKISDGFMGSNTCGLNLLNLWMDFREDPENGEVKCDRLPFNSFIMDPYWTKKDLSDCDWIWSRRYLSEMQIKSIFPSIEKEIPYLGKGYAAKDGKFQFLAQNWYQYQQQMYAYDEYWTREYKTVRKLIDRSTGEVVPWKGTREQLQMLRRFNPNIETIKAYAPTIKLHVLINNHVVYEEVSPYGLDKFPFVPFTCYHYPEVQNYAYRYQGIVRNIRDSQIELNRRRNRLLDILDAQIQSGLMVKEDALVNPEDAFFQGPGKVLYFKNTANLQTDQMQFAPPPVGSGWLELIQSIEKEIMDIVGPEELFAQNMGAKEMSGVLMKLKMGAGLTGLRNVFDSLNNSQMILSGIWDDMIVNNFSPGKVKKILGHEPSQLFFDNEFTKYNCVVEEAEMTSTQRQLKFLQAVQLKQIIPDAIPDDYLLEVSSLQDKKKIVEMAKQKAQQAQQMQQMAAMQQMQQGEILNRSIEAKAQSDFASAQEKMATSVQKIALAKQEASQAVHQRASAALDNAKALHELSTMPEERLMNLSNFILDLQLKQKEIAGFEEEDSKATADAEGSGSRQSERETKPSALNQAMQGSQT